MLSTTEACKSRPRIHFGNRGLPRGRRIVTVEWDKLFAEAIEKDTKERLDFRLSHGSNDSECEDSEGEYVGDVEVNENENSEMPLNLCYKSNTAPNISTRFEAESSPNGTPATDKSSVKDHECETGKQVSCTMPSFKARNGRSLHATALRPRNDGDDCSQKQETRDKEEDAVAGSKSNVSQNGTTQLNSNLGSNRKPMKELNHLDQNKRVINSVGKKISFDIDKPQPKDTNQLESKSIALDMQESKIAQGDVQNADGKCQKSSSNSVCNQPDGNIQKTNEPQPKETKSSQQQHEAARFAVPAVPEKIRSSDRTIVVNGKPYKVLAPLGKGGSSSVYLGLNLQNELLAIKCVKLAGLSKKIREDYLHEIQYLMKMQHSKHVIKLYDHQYLASNKVLYAVMEKGDTDLSRFLKDKAASEEGITPESILYYWSEMLLAVKCIHDNNIIHRDLKPANFLLVAGRLKLIDFGIASSIQNEETSILMNSQSGTFNYMSPEALLDLGSGNEVVLKIGRESDVWSLGCILYYFLYKKTPYQDLVKPIQKMRAITDPNHVVEFPRLHGVPDVLIESCKRCLIYDRKKRASIEELLDMKNKPLLTLSQVLSRLKSTLPEKEYQKAVEALTDEIDKGE